MEYYRNPIADFTAGQIALGFINALKLQGLEPATEQQLAYTYMSDEYPEDNVVIDIEAAQGAPYDKTTRAHVMYMLRVLPIALLGDNYLHGVEFHERYMRETLYSGIFDSKNDPLRLGMANHTESRGDIATSKKRAMQISSLSVQQMNTTTTVLTAPNTNERLELSFRFVGFDIPRVGFFYTIIQMMFGNGLRDASERVNSAQISQPGLPAWVFISTERDLVFPFEGYHVLAILEAIARYAVLQNTYQELVYNFTVDGVLVSTGCVTKAAWTRRWCGGLV